MEKKLQPSKVKLCSSRREWKRYSHHLLPRGDNANGLCRMCVVEVEGMRVLQPACIVEAANNMKVQTRSEKVVRARKTILEMLASTIDLSEAADIQVMMNEYSVDVNRFPDAERREVEVKDDNPMYVRDYSNASCAGVVCRSVQTMRNIHMRSTSRDVAMKPKLARSSIKSFLKRLVFYADNVWVCVLPARWNRNVNFCWSRG